MPAHAALPPLLAACWEKGPTSVHGCRSRTEVPVASSAEMQAIATRLHTLLLERESGGQQPRGKRLGSRPEELPGIAAPSEEQRPMPGMAEAAAGGATAAARPAQEETAGAETASTAPSSAPVAPAPASVGNPEHGLRRRGAGQTQPAPIPAPQAQGATWSPRLDTDAALDRLIYLLVVAIGLILVRKVARIALAWVSGNRSMV